MHTCMLAIIVYPSHLRSGHRPCNTPRASMPIVKDMRHPRCLDFDMQRKVVMLRDDKKMSWDDIADPAKGGVKNLQGKATCRDVARRAYNKFFKRGREKGKYDYKKSGRKAWKLTPEVQQYLTKQLFKTRKNDVCTSKTLQFLLVRDKGVALDESSIRKCLRKRGYKWLPRAQKRKDSRAEKIRRLAFVKAKLRMTVAELRKELGLSIDGVVLPLPPGDMLGRWNHCMAGETHMWRKPCEAASAELAGDDAYANQVRIDRALPFWGGISEGGCGHIVFHENKKCTTGEWVDAIRGGALGGLLRRLNPQIKERPWRILCDGEHFLHSKDSQKACDRHSISLWKIPPHSPDLNPIEVFWSWLRRELRRRDLEDCKRKRPALTKAQYTSRVKAILQSRTANRKAANIAKGFRKVCKEVLKKKGAAARS